MPLEQSYTAQSAGSAANSATTAAKPGDYWELHKLRKCYTDYLFSKREEIDEQIDARRYYHGSQWTTEQITAMKKRRQPVMTFNRIARKIDGVCGLIERLRQDPKAYPRTPKHEEGAELATATIRFVLDEQEWKAKSPQAAQDGAVDGVAGVEIDITQGDQGDPDVGLGLVDVQSFFYDPRSYQMDFEDARYMGIGKWLDDDIAQEMFPDAEEGAFIGNDSELTSDSDRERRWFSSDGVQKRVRIVDIWYRHKGGWCYAIFSGNSILMEGKSYLQDEDGKDFCKYIMFSGNVDQDGDRYGFIRNMKSAQDGINAKQSRMQHMLHSKRLFIRKGGVSDIEVVRREYARNDGVVETIGPVDQDVKADDQSFDFAGMSKLLELNLAEIENYGPNPALIGQGIENKSGRAIALLQQAGIAELGPYILAFKGWKIRVYRAIWNAIQKHWKAERWIRVTDDEGLAQFIQINGMQVDPNTGQPQLVNAIGSLDVDIIMDEAPDSINLQAESYEILQALGPNFVDRFPEIAIELSPIDTATKKKMREKITAPDPRQEIEAEAGKAKVHQTHADAELKEAQTAKTIQEAHLAPLQAMMDGQQPGMPPQEYEITPELQNAQAVADIEDTQAASEQKRAQAFKAHQDAMMAPQKMRMDMMNAAEDRKMQAQQFKQKATQARR